MNEFLLAAAALQLAARRLRRVNKRLKRFQELRI